MKRVSIPELLDSDAGTPGEVAASLGDLESVNRRFGGVATTLAMVERVAGSRKLRSLSLLEVAAGSGLAPFAVQERLAGNGIQISVTLLDRAASHLKNGAADRRRIVGDALALPFSDASFDVVSCGLFVHHLSPAQVVQFLREGLRVCRVAVLINDLVRHPVHLALVYAGMPLYHSRLTRHDAPASVRGAYTPDEIRELIAQTPAAQVEILRRYLFRMGVIVWKA